MRYFIGNWKMFGVPKSINILKKINFFYSKDKKRSNYRIIITPPYTLIGEFSKHFKKKKIQIGSNLRKSYGFRSISLSLTLMI